jgi:hypothetical protein
MCNVFASKFDGCVKSRWYIDERRKAECLVQRRGFDMFRVRYKDVDSIRLRSLVLVMEVVLNWEYAMNHRRERKFN